MSRLIHGKRNRPFFWSVPPVRAKFFQGLPGCAWARTTLMGATMSDSLEEKYHRFNLILSVVIGGLLATVGGLWLYQNKDYKLSSISPVKWVTDKALKNSDAGLPKFEAVKGIEFDASKPINWQGVLSNDQARKIERDFGK